MPAVQNYARKQIVSQLKTKLNVDLDINSLHFQPFNTIELNNVYIHDQKDSSILFAKKIYGNVDLYDLVHHKFIINAIRLSDFTVHLSKETKESPLNIQFIIDAFKSDSTKSKSKFDIKLTAITISNGQFSFDINNQAPKINKFDPNHIDVSHLNARLALKSLKSDSLNIQIRSLGLEEKSGLKISNLVTRVITHDKKIAIKGFALDLPKSLLKLDSCNIDLSNVESSMDLLEHATFNLSASSSYIALKDISALVPAFKNFEDRIYLKAKIIGSIDNLEMTQLSLEYGDKMHIEANAQVKDVRTPEKMYLMGRIDELKITKSGIEGLLNNFSQDKKSIPPQIANLGTVSFRGDLSGYLTKLTAFGTFKTELGMVTTDLLFGFRPKDGIDAYFNGKVSTPNFDVGRLTSQSDLNKLSFDLAVNLKKPTGRKLGGTVIGKIHEFDYKGYAYKEISLNGNYNGLKLDGDFLLNDENAFVKMDGLIDLSNKVPVLNFVANVKNVRFDKLNLSQKYIDTYLSFNINANFTGKNIDDAIGSLSIDSLKFLRPDKSFLMNQLVIQASGVSADRKLSVKSDIINGEVLGAYSFSTMLTSLKKTVNIYLPALISSEKLGKRNVAPNNLSLDFTINNSQQITDVFNLPVTILKPVRIAGFYNNIYNKFRLEINCPSLKAGKTLIQSGYLLTENSYDQINSTIKGVTVAQNGTLNTIGVNLSAKDNVLNSDLLFSNNGAKTLSGELITATTFSRIKDAPLKTIVDILPSKFNLHDTIWTMNQSQITLDSSYVDVHRFLIQGQEHSQSVSIDGRISRKNPEDIIYLSLKSIDLNYVFALLNIPALNFGGYATGTLEASSLNEKIYTNVNLKVKNFAFNNSTLGYLSLSSYLDEKTNRINLDGTVLSDENKITKVNGFINPISQELSIDFDANRINIGFLNKYVHTLFNNVSGRGSGHVRLFGDTHNVTVEGKAFIDNATLGINTLNATYTFSDTIFMKKDLIYFNNIHFKDKFGHIAAVSGKVAHNYFADFNYFINFEGNNFLVYNATKEQNQTFNGTVFATGTGNIAGNEQALDITAHMATNKNTKVYMDFMENVANEYSFMTYKNSRDSVETTTNTNEPKPIVHEKGMQINMNFFVDATPDANVEMLMDPVGGDKITGIGSGSLQFVWSTDAEPKLFGTYTINRGNYKFTFQKLFERNFTIQDGSSVQFRGDPYGATMNVDAAYRLTANLNDLDKDLVTNSGQSNVPVNCLLNLTGELKNFNVKVDVELPNADSEIQRQARSIMSMDDDQIYRQFASLLILSKFYTPSYGNTDNTTNSFASVASATLSTQIGNLLNQIDDRLQVGTNIRTSDAQFTTSEFDLLLSSKLLNGRLLINGNFGYREDPNLPSTFIGDVDLEYLLTNSGNWRIKLYNHSNEKYYLLPNPNGRSIQTQGVGLLYKKDFENLKDLFSIKQKAIPKDSTVILPDSTHIGSSLGSFVKIKK